MSSRWADLSEEAIPSEGGSTRLHAARQHRHELKYGQAVQELEEALKEGEDSEIVWGELASALYDSWERLVTLLHDPLCLEGVRVGLDCADDALGKVTLQRAYNAFIVAMEFPANKRQPLLLLKLVMLYFEFRAYHGALSVCTLLVEGYGKQPAIRESVFLCAVSAQALRRHRESANYFVYLADHPPYKLSAHHMYLLAAIELDKADGARDAAREAYSQAYKAMIGLSPTTSSERTAHHLYKTSHKNEVQRAQIWIRDYATWIELAKKLAAHNFPLLVCGIFDVTYVQSHSIQREDLILQGMCRYRIGEIHRASEMLALALRMNYWCKHCRYLLTRVSDTWRIQFHNEDAAAKAIQHTLRRYWKRLMWRSVAQRLTIRKRDRKARMIQFAWRQHLARLKSAALAKLYRDREEVEIALIAAEDWIAIAKRQNLASRKIQSLYALFVAKKEVRLRLAIRDRRNIVFQSLTTAKSRNTKRYVLTTWQHFVFLEKQNRDAAASLIQRNVRGFFDRKSYYRLLQAKVRSQEIIVMCSSRNALRVERQALNVWHQFALQRREMKFQGSQRIQRAWRRYLDRKRYNHELRRHALATDLMHKMVADKRNLQMRSMWETLARNAVICRMKKHRCAVTIQRHVRGLLARKTVRALRSKNRRLAIILNTMLSRSNKRVLKTVFDGLFRFVGSRRKQREESAAVVQRIYRRRLVKKRERFLAECNRILREPEMTLRGKSPPYVKRVCFVVIAMLRQQNRIDRSMASSIIQKWYRSTMRRRCLRSSLDKLRRQRDILRILHVNFLSLALLFFQQLKTRVKSKKSHQDQMARRIQRMISSWVNYRRFRRLLTFREHQKARVDRYVRNHQLQLTRRCFNAWRVNLYSEWHMFSDAAQRIQRMYRTRRARLDAKRTLNKHAARARLLDSFHLKPLERCFLQWEERIIKRGIMMVRSAAKSANELTTAKSRAAIMNTDSICGQPAPLETIEQRAKLPSLLFYSLLSRVRQSGVLQLSLAPAFPALTIRQLQQLCGFASSIIVDGGGNRGGEPHLAELVVDAMVSTQHPCPTQKLILYNSRLSSAHMKALQAALRRPYAQTTSLVLCNMELSNVGVMALAISICHGHSKLEQVVLEACGIGSAGASAIAEALCHSKLLWKLDLSHNRIGDSACAALAQALVVSASLRVVALSGNAISDRGALRHLAPALRRVMDAPSSRLECVVLRQLPRISPRGRDALQQATSRWPPTRLAVLVD